MRVVQHRLGKKTGGAFRPARLMSCRCEPGPPSGKRFADAALHDLLAELGAGGGFAAQILAAVGALAMVRVHEAVFQSRRSRPRVAGGLSRGATQEQEGAPGLCLADRLTG